MELAMTKKKTGSPNKEVKVIRRKPMDKAIQSLFYQDQTPVIEQSWDDLEVIYQTYLHSMYGVMQTLNEMISIPGLTSYIKEKDTFNTALNTLSKDYEKLLNDLDGIHDKHKEMKGKVKSESELSMSFQLGGQYSVLFERYQSLTLPTIMSLTDMATDARDVWVKEQTAMKAN